MNMTKQELLTAAARDALESTVVELQKSAVALVIRMTEIAD